MTSDEKPEVHILTPEEEAKMIFSDRPILRTFACPFSDCEEVIPIHADVDLVLVLTEEEEASGQHTPGTPLRFAFVPSIYPEAFEMHLMFDHGASVEIHHVSQAEIEDEEEDD